MLQAVKINAMSKSPQQDDNKFVYKVSEKEEYYKGKVCTFKGMLCKWDLKLKI